MYAKIENGQLKYAPRNIILNGMRIVNPSAEQYAEEGWLPLELTVIPSDGNKTATATYLERDGKIVQSWTLSDAPTPEPTPEEIAALEQAAAQQPAPEPTAEERLDEIEAALIELAEIVGG